MSCNLTSRLIFCYFMQKQRSVVFICPGHQGTALLCQSPGASLGCEIRLGEAVGKDRL